MSLHWYYVILLRCKLTNKASISTMVWPIKFMICDGKLWRKYLQRHAKSDSWTTLLNPQSALIAKLTIDDHASEVSIADKSRWLIRKWNFTCKYVALNVPWVKFHSRISSDDLSVSEISLADKFWRPICEWNFTRG